MSVKYKDSNGNIEDIAGGLTADMAQDMIDTSLTPVNITSNITWDTSKFTVFSSETNVWKIGRLVVCLLKGTLLSSAGYNTIGTGFPQPFSSNNVANFTFVTNDGSTGTKSGCGYINNSGNICVRFADGTGEFAANFSYIARE